MFSRQYQSIEDAPASYGDPTHDIPVSTTVYLGLNAPDGETALQADDGADEDGVIVLSTVTLGFAIVVEASLSFLGVGIPPELPTWGGMLTLGASRYINTAPCWLFSPASPSPWSCSRSTCWVTPCATFWTRSCAAVYNRDVLEITRYEVCVRLPRGVLQVAAQKSSFLHTTSDICAHHESSSPLYNKLHGFQHKLLNVDSP